MNEDQEVKCLYCYRCSKEADELYKYNDELLCLHCLADNFYKVFADNHFKENYDEHGNADGTD